jgi:5'-nucleotidase
VLSGVNRGNNAAENAVYSGTLGGAMEAALQGLPAIALSQYFGPGNRDIADPFEAARTHGPELVRDLMARDTPAEDGYRLFYSVNFPPFPAAGVCAAAAWRRRGFARQPALACCPHVAPSGRRFLWVTGGDQHRPTAPRHRRPRSISMAISRSRRCVPI